jgi:hypothetical protein
MGGEEQIGLQWTPGSLAICRVFPCEVKAIYPFYGFRFDKG